MAMKRNYDSMISESKTDAVDCPQSGRIQTYYTEMDRPSPYILGRYRPSFTHPSYAFVYNGRRKENEIRDIQDKKEVSIARWKQRLIVGIEMPSISLTVKPGTKEGYEMSETKIKPPKGMIQEERKEWKRRKTIE